MDHIRRLIGNQSGLFRDFLLLLRNNSVSVKGGSHSVQLAAIRKGHPSGRTRLFLYAGIIPVVKAWSPWKKSDEENQTGVRMINKKDQAISADIAKADELYKTGNRANYDEAYLILFNHVGKSEPEVLWRLGRLLYDQAKVVTKAEEKKAKIEYAYKILSEALELDDQNFSVHKWMAILLNELSSLKGTKEQILESFNVKKHMLRAAELNPEDATCIYLLGHWCFTVADIPWYQRKIAATLFASPPECTFREAYQHFLRAEDTKPGFYSMNLLMLAKSAIKIGENERAEEYLMKLKGVRIKTEDDYLAKKEGKKIRESLFKKAHFDESKETPKPSEEAKA